MAPPRRKAPKQEAPQTLEQAIALISEYRDIADALGGLALEADNAIAQISAAHDAQAKPLELRNVEIFKQLRAWWGVAASELTDGKRKSIPLAGCTIGERTTPPALKLTGITADALVAKLDEAGLDALLRRTTKLDKPTAIKAILAEDEIGQLLIEMGASTRQVEEFFIDWPKPAATETVADLEPNQ